ncbi:MAG: hypothetical protein RJB66_6, partial [Pseudomonadota bacterium]
MQKAELILLDTHVWIWLMGEHPRLASSKSLGLIQKASKAQSIRV